MIRAVNPYNALPFYQSVQDDDRECVIYSPTRYLPQFQIESNTALSGANAYLESLNGTYSQALPALEIINTTDGKGYLTYTGTTLSGVPDDGLYRIRVDVVSGAGFDYQSHVLCLSSKFNPQDWEPVIACSTISGGGFAFQVNFDYDPNLPTEVEVNYGTGWVRLGTGISGKGDPAMMYSNLMTDNSARFRLKVWLDDAHFWREYLYTYDPLEVDPCTTDTFPEVATGGQGYDRFICLEWQNTNDLAALGILYTQLEAPNGFLQQFYTEAHAEQAAVLNEEVFLENGAGERILDYTKIARLYNVNFYPVPDACIAPLTAISSHNVIQLRIIPDTWNNIAHRAGFEATAQDELLCSIGKMQIELNRELIGCQDNKTEI